MSFLTNIAHVLLPQESNNYKARLLHSPSIVLLLLFVIAFQNILSLAPRLGIDVLGYAANISPQEVIRLTNERRAESGVSSLTENSTLTAAARAKGEHMLANDYWAHIAPDGTEPWYFFQEVGYDYKYAGENLARDFSNPKDAVEAWMASPSHKENLLSSKYHEIGIAVVEGDLNGVDTTIIVQLFGSTAVDTPSVVPVAAAEEVRPLPSSTPTPTAEAVAYNPVEMVSGERVAQVSTVKASPFSLTQVFSFGLVMLVASVVVIDAFVVEQKGISRVSGRWFAHFTFLVMVGTIILIAKAGTIF